MDREEEEERKEGRGRDERGKNVVFSYLVDLCR